MKRHVLYVSLSTGFFNRSHAKAVYTHQGVEDRFFMKAAYATSGLVESASHAARTRHTANLSRRGGRAAGRGSDGVRAGARARAKARARAER
eukprot:6198183-Pleurochrysis_carterae.AAC.2